MTEYESRGWECDGGCCELDDVDEVVGSEAGAFAFLELTERLSELQLSGGKARLCDLA